MLIFQIPWIKLIHSLTHWGQMTHICVSKLTILGSDNGLLLGRRQTIIWTNDGILSTGPLETNFSKILIEIHIFLFKKMPFKVLSVKWRPFCLGLNVLIKLPSSLQWCYMSITVFQITCNLTICSTALHYWPFLMGIHQWPVDSQKYRKGFYVITSSCKMWTNWWSVKVAVPCTDSIPTCNGILTGAILRLGILHHSPFTHQYYALCSVRSPYNPRQWLPILLGTVANGWDKCVGGTH